MRSTYRKAVDFAWEVMPLFVMFSIGCAVIIGAVAFVQLLIGRPAVPPAAIPTVCECDESWRNSSRQMTEIRGRIERLERRRGGDAGEAGQIGEQGP